MIAIPYSQTQVNGQAPQGAQPPQQAPGAMPQAGAAAPGEDQAQLLTLLQMLQQSQQNGDGGSVPSIPGGGLQPGQNDPGLNAMGVPQGNNTGALMNMLHQMGM